MSNQELIQTFSHSIKIEETAKGLRVSIHVYANSEQDAITSVLSTYEKTLTANVNDLNVKCMNCSIRTG